MMYGRRLRNFLRRRCSQMPSGGRQGSSLPPPPPSIGSSSSSSPQSPPGGVAGPVLTCQILSTRAAECSDLRAASATSPPPSGSDPRQRSCRCRRHPSLLRCSANPLLPTGAGTCAWWSPADCQPLREARFRRRVLLGSRGCRGSRCCRCCPCPPQQCRRQGERSARAHAALSRMVLSSDRKAGCVVIVADAGTATPALLLLPFAFAVVPMDGLGQFYGTFFGRTASSSSFVAIVHDDDTGVG